MTIEETAGQARPQTTPRPLPTDITEADYPRVLEAIAELGGNTPGNASKVAAKLNIKLKGIQAFLVSQEKPETSENAGGAITGGPLPDDLGANGELEHAKLPATSTATATTTQTPARRGRPPKSPAPNAAAPVAKKPELSQDDLIAIGELTADLVAKGKTLADHVEDIRAEAELLRKLSFTI